MDVRVSVQCQRAGGDEQEGLRGDQCDRPRARFWVGSDDGERLPSDGVRRTFTGVSGDDDVLDDDLVGVERGRVVGASVNECDGWRQRSDVEAQLQLAWRLSCLRRQRDRILEGDLRRVADRRHLADAHVEEASPRLRVELVRTMIEWARLSCAGCCTPATLAHGLYERLGFGAADETYLERPPAEPAAEGHRWGRGRGGDAENQWRVHRSRRRSNWCARSRSVDARTAGRGAGFAQLGGWRAPATIDTPPHVRRGALPERNRRGPARWC